MKQRKRSCINDCWSFCYLLWLLCLNGQNRLLFQFSHIDISWNSLRKNPFCFYRAFCKDLRFHISIDFNQITTCNAAVPLDMVGKLFSPIQTSPKQPCPSFRSRRRDSRGISQASLASPWVWGLATGHTSVKAWHSPSECSETGDKEARVKIWVGAVGGGGVVCPCTHCGNGRLAAVGW